MDPVKQEAQPPIKPEPNWDGDAPMGAIPTAENAAVPPVKPDPEFVTESDESKIPEMGHLQQLVGETSPETLEGGVEIGVQLLEQLKARLKAALPNGDTDAPHWLSAIQDLQSQSKPTRTVVGVVGNTGAGKSSVINALLDEERLLPTNCLRACTASPTEISWNDSNDPDELYRGEVEFISAEDWRRELEGLMNDLLDGTGEVSRDCTNPDSEAGVAYAKIKAVYPHMTREDIKLAIAEKLADWKTVRCVLGSVKRLKEGTSSALYRGLQHYVDSKEKVAGRPKKDATIEYWPLIKVVRIYTKAPALSTGAVIVDLPGVQDSNAARAAVAAKYMKACTGLWIVAPINRAVDDKTAKSLLGDPFKRQLKYDGAYSAVTFICSKTDDLSITEAADSLDLEAEVSESLKQVDAFQMQLESMKRRIGELRDEKAALEETMDDLDARYDLWEDLASKLIDGEVVYAPSPKAPANRGKKRKRESLPSGSRKNHVSLDSDDESTGNFSDMNDNSMSDKENGQPSEDRDRPPLTQDEIDEVMASIKQEKKKIRSKRREYDGTISDIKKDIRSVGDEKANLESKVRAICIKGRNTYSREAIRRDFAMGIKELDQEAAIERDEEQFNPDEDIRDYDEVAEALPVFCVSSRAYQSISGRFLQDKFGNSGFKTVQDTEIPQLQQHARKMTEARRASNCRAFLNGLNRLLNSMKLWATTSRIQSNLSIHDQKLEAEHLRSLLDHLDQSFTNTTEDCCSTIKEALADQIFDAFDRTIPSAVEAALPTAEAWGAPRALGGLFWGTYRATCRRFGVFCGAAGPRDFNAELFEPISKMLASPWEKTFQMRIPIALDAYQNAVKQHLNTFHQQATANAAKRGTSIAGVSTLTQILRAHKQTISESPGALKVMITELQRDANRGFTPVIQEMMNWAYVEAVNERGPGSYTRMKQRMETHVREVRHSIFRQATGEVKEQLVAMCRRVENTMLGITEDIHEKMERDYEAVLVGRGAGSHDLVPRAEKILRAEIATELARVDAAFAPLPNTNDGADDTSAILDASSAHDSGADDPDHDLSDASSTAKDGNLEEPGSETCGSKLDGLTDSSDEENQIAAQLNGTAEVRYTSAATEDDLVSQTRSFKAL